MSPKYNRQASWDRLPQSSPDGAVGCPEHIKSLGRNQSIDTRSSMKRQEQRNPTAILKDHWVFPHSPSFPHHTTVYIQQADQPFCISTMSGEAVQWVEHDDNFCVKGLRVDTCKECMG